MYNLNIPTQLKKAILILSHVLALLSNIQQRGPEGLLKGKKAIVLCAFGDYMMKKI